MEAVVNNKIIPNEDYEIIKWFEDISEKAGLVQTETLRRIIEMNFETEYLKKWLGNDLNIQEMDSNSIESLYTSLVPLVSHADLEPYILRIADGDLTPVLTQEAITTLSLSSGTTEGRQKYVPFTRHSSQTTLQMFRLAAAYRSRVFPIREGGRILEFIYSSAQSRTKGGIAVGTATSHYYASEEFKIKQTKTKSFTCSPQEVISGGDYKESTYCHLLLGLIFCDQVEFITSTFAYSIVQAFTTFEEVWECIVQDIREGTLNSVKVTSNKMRKAKCKELDVTDWFSVIPKLWPNAKYVYSIMTGSMQPYLKKLRHYSGSLPIVCADYGSTESWIGVNIEPCCPPEDVSFTIVPTFSYFEFIPLHRDKKGYISTPSAAIDDFIEDEPVPLSKVKIGQEYELVLTTFTGLYRYRLGDVVEVAGFYKGTPKLNFTCRRKLILTVNIDKNTEKDLQFVVERGSQLLSREKAEIVDFTSHANVTKQPGNYVIYWEIKGEVEEGTLSECCREMDESFVDYGYVVSRKSKSIGPLELCIFKTPRCTSNQVILRILNVYTVKRVHSTAYGGR
ncbi:hypothetical protein MKW92_031264 [Papaver armeniacum]|nr:hypothetical protein MKW92_031264 [Papaver armeniacum]